MELYGFGFNAHDLFPDFGNNYEPRGSQSNLDPVLSPKRHVRGRQINLLWVSWCDALVQIFRFEEDTKPGVLADPLIVYTGEGISTFQLCSLATTSSGNRGHGPQASLTIFGAEFGEGLKGAITRSCADSFSRVDSMVTSFLSVYEREPTDRDEEIFKIVRDEESPPKTLKCEVISSRGHMKGKEAAYRITNLAMTSGGTVSAIAEVLNPVSRAEETTTNTQNQTPQAKLLSFPSLPDFRAWLMDSQNPEPHLFWPEPLYPQQNNWKQLIANSVTFTALSDEGNVYTWAPDRRYSLCLGRDTQIGRPEAPCQVEFLSETKVIKIASGGYMTAALSEDGEFFIWGQACPGIKGELRILKASENGVDEDGYEHEDEQDEWVKFVDIKMHGKSARVIDVAVGSGHVLVSAELETEGGVERAVFAAGQCEYGQLGIGEKRAFVDDFVEVPALKGKKVVSLAAAGWSSWVVVGQE